MDNQEGAVTSEDIALETSKDPDLVKVLEDLQKGRPSDQLKHKYLRNCL